MLLIEILSDESVLKGRQLAAGWLLGGGGGGGSGGGGICVVLEWEQVEQLIPIQRAIDFSFA